MGTVQFCGYVKTSKLPPLSPDLAAPKPPIDENSPDKGEATLSLAAGSTINIYLLLMSQN